MDSNLEVFSLPFSRRMEKCAQPMLPFSVLVCAARTWKFEIMSIRFTWLAVCVMMGGACQCAGTGPCELVSVTTCCIDRCGVAMQTHQVVSATNNEQRTTKNNTQHTAHNTQHTTPQHTTHTTHNTHNKKQQESTRINKKQQQQQHQ